MKSVKVNGRWDIILPDHRADRAEWVSETGWERARLDSMFETTKPGDVVYYVGAESGDMAGLLAMWGAKLVLFEPNEKAWPQIKSVWEANKLSAPEMMIEGFASDKTSAEYKYFPWPESAKGEIVPDHGFKELSDPAELPQVKIDDLNMVPNMISIDVEGSEGKVLRGAEQTLRKYHPRIYLSLHPEFMRTYDEWGAELRKWIIDLGYKETLLDYPLHEVHLLYEVA